VKQGSPHKSSSLISGKYRCSLLFSRSLSYRALSTRACVTVFIASPSRGGSRITVVGRGLFCIGLFLGALSGCSVLDPAIVVPMIPTPAIVMLYIASLGPPGGGLDANMKACVVIYLASDVFGMMCPLVSIDIKDISRFWIKFSRSCPGTFASRDLPLARTSLWLSPDVLDCRLRAALCALDAEVVVFLASSAILCFSNSRPARASLY
jgi:hypothetical protein